MTKERKNFEEKEGLQSSDWITGGTQFANSPERILREINEQGTAHSQFALRRILLRGLGAIANKEAEDVVIPGCMTPYLNPLKLRSYFQLLRLLGVEYNLVEDEYCCAYGATLIDQHLEEREDLLAQVKNCGQRNIDQVRAQGAKKVFYFCYGCFGAAHKFFGKEADLTVGYGLDILFEPMKKVSQLKAPAAVVGYYRGCWRQPIERSPDLKLPFDTWHSWLDRIEGIKVVDLPTSICCDKNPEAVVRTAKANDVDYIVTPCMGCYGRVYHVREGMKVIMLHELLLESLMYKG